MRRLEVPEFDAWDTTVNAAKKFNGSVFEGRVLGAEADFKTVYEGYHQASAESNWYELPSCSYGQPDQEIFAGFTKSELTNLYSNGLVNGLVDARDIYDQIKVAAEGRCPYCGGIGSVDPLDHYLPKSRYPQFAVCPTNLIPCCDRCNKLSGASVLESYEGQTLNPYFDDQKFFNEPWVFVDFPTASILQYSYFFAPPDDWSQADKERAERHFNDLKLGERYISAASTEVSYLAGSFVTAMRGNLTPDQVRQLLEARAEAEDYDVNGWQRPLFRALAGAAWFLDAFA